MLNKDIIYNKEINYKNPNAPQPFDIDELAAAIPPETNASPATAHPAGPLTNASIAKPPAKAPPPANNDSVLSLPVHFLLPEPLSSPGGDAIVN